MNSKQAYLNFIYDFFFSSKFKCNDYYNKNMSNKFELQ